MLRRYHYCHLQSRYFFLITSSTSSQRFSSSSSSSPPRHPSTESNTKTGKDYRAKYASHSESTLPKLVIIFPFMVFVGSYIFEVLLEISPFREEGSRPGWKRGSLFPFNKNLLSWNRGEVPKHGEQQAYLKRKKEQEEKEEEYKKRGN